MKLLLLKKKKRKRKKKRKLRMNNVYALAAVSHVVNVANAKVKKFHAAVASAHCVV